MVCRNGSTTSLCSAVKKIIIKMDVEGHEFQALAGMRQTLRRNACYVQVELFSDRPMNCSSSLPDLAIDLSIPKTSIFLHQYAEIE